MRKPYIPSSVLLIITRQIGDVLLTTPLLRSMRKAWPQAKIDILVYKNTAGILEGNTDCTSIIESEQKPGIKEYWRLLKRIFFQYDLAITTLSGDRPHQYALLASYQRIGIVPATRRHGIWKRLICKRWIKLDNIHTHTVVQNLLLAGCLEINALYEIVPPSKPQPESDLDAMLEFEWRIEEYAVVHPFPMWQYKRWTDAGWHALLDHLLASGKHVVLTGGPADEERSYCENLVLEYQSRQVPNKTRNVGVISIAGKTSFALMSKLLQHAAVYIGPDTVTTHLSAACNTPTLALFGPTNPVKWGPWPFGYASAESPWQNVSPLQQRNNVAILQGLGNCVPCHKAGCNDHNASVSVCMDELPASRVIHALEELLSSVSERKLLILSNTSSTVGG